MAGGARIGGQGGAIKRTLWVFVACCIVIAIWGSVPHDAKGFYSMLEHKADQLKGVAQGVVEWAGLTANDGTNTDPAPAPAKPKAPAAPQAR